MADLNDPSPASSPQPSAAPSMDRVHQDRAHQDVPQQSGERHTPSHGEPQALSPSADQQGEQTRESLLEAVTKAVPELQEGRTDRVSKEPPSGAPLAPGTQADTAAQRVASPDELPDEVSPDELSQYNPQTRRRINKLVEQRRGLRTELDRVKANLGPGAEAADQVSTYLRNNDISREDFLLTLELAAAMRRGDFRSFYAGVKPYMDLAEQYLGVQLPQDLQQVVQRGEMSPQAAALFHRERMDRALSDTQRMRQAQAIDMRDTASAHQHLRSSVENSVNAWEASVVAADPDYALKKAAVNDVMWSVLNERGRPETPEAAVAIAQEAYRRVNTHYAQWGPPPRRSTTRQPSSTGRFNGAAPEPRNLREAVEQAIDRARA